MPFTNIKYSIFKINKPYQYKFIFLFFLFIFSGQLVQAHTPPNAGKIDCGTIQGGVFYSEYYDPPTGTPAVNGSCSWIKQGSRSCGTYCYNGVNYSLYTYIYVCNSPIDSQFYLIGLGALSFVAIRKRRFFIV